MGEGWVSMSAAGGAIVSVGIVFGIQYGEW